MAYTYTWNSAFEALPADANNVSDGANKIRNLKYAIRERLAKDHYMDTAGTDADHGEHSQITFHGNVATPANIADKGTMYPQLVSSKLELHYKDNANQITQITSNGTVNFTSPIPANTVMLFYADTAPTGWTIKNTNEWNDITVMLTKGSAAGGANGGTNHATGTWTQPDHTLTTDEIPSHRHAVQQQANDTASGATDNGTIGSGTTYYSGYTGGGNAHNHGTTWRPAAKNFIVCEKN